MRTASVAFLSLFLTACGDTYITVPTAPGAPNTSTVAVTNTRVEFRVTGNATSARIRFLNPSDGLTQVTTVLPYYTSFVSSQDELFVSLEATPQGYPASANPAFLSIQIFMNGLLFREASSSDILLSTLSVSGTYRKSASVESPAATRYYIRGFRLLPAHGHYVPQ